MVNKKALISTKVQRYMLIDVAILALFYYVPAWSHELHFPLYIFEPMRLSLFCGLILSKNYKNGYFLALTLPFFSFAVSSHPVFLKCMIMAIELVLNVYLIKVFINIFNKLFISVCLSIFLSKVIYYVLKSCMVSSGLLIVGLVDTPIMIQLFVTFFISFIYSISIKYQNCK